MRRTVVLCLALLITTLPTPPPALARGSGGLPVVLEKNLEKGLGQLRLAEKARSDKNQPLATRHGRQAERIFLDVLAQDPRNLQAAFYGGQAAAFIRDLRGAAEWVERYRRLSPAGERDPDFHFLSAFVHLFGAQRPERAVRSLTRMYSINPRRRPIERDNLWYMALSAQGTRLLEAKDVEEAIEQFKAAMRIARRLGNRRKELLMLANLGITLQRGARYLEAHDIFESLIKAEKNNPIWHWQLAFNYASQSQFGEAVTVYREIIRLRESGFNVPEMEDELGQVRLRLGNCLRHLAERQRDPKKRAQLLKQAEADIRSYVKEHPEDMRGHKWLGTLLFENLERPYDALPYFKKAFELEPLCAGPLRNMIQIHEHYPPPPDAAAPDDPAEAAARLAAWRAPIKAWKKDLKEGAKRRKRILQERKDRTGDDGCT